MLTDSPSDSSSVPGTGSALPGPAVVTASVVLLSRAPFMLLMTRFTARYATSEKISSAMMKVRKKFFIADSMIALSSSPFPDTVRVKTKCDYIII